MRPSENRRHDTLSDVKLFLEKNHPQHAKTVEVVCSSARRDMDHHATHTALLLFDPLTVEDKLMTSWPQTTDVWCWHCCHPFATVPMCIPRSRSLYENENAYHVYGTFCSCNCAIAFILDQDTHDQQCLLLRFKEMAPKVYQLAGKPGGASDISSAGPAPPRFALRVFGGPKTIEEFRATSLVAHSSLLLPPFISYTMLLEETSREKRRTMNNEDGSVSAITSHAVRGLRRPTQLPETPVVLENHPSGAAFSQFKETQESMNTGGGDCGGDPMADEDEDKNTTTSALSGGDNKAPRRSTRRTYRRATPAAQAGAVGVGISAGAGTLAAFLRPVVAVNSENK